MGEMRRREEIEAGTDEPQLSARPDDAETPGPAALREEIARLDREQMECTARRNDAESQARGLRELLDVLPRKLPQAASWALGNLIHDARRAQLMAPLSTPTGAGMATGAGMVSGSGGASGSQHRR